MRKTFTYITTALFLLGCSSENTTTQKKIPTQSQSNQNIIETSCNSQMAFSKPQKLSHEAEDFRILGKSFFKVPWVEAPSATTARDGLGPLFSANTCIHCHPGNGAGVAVEKDGKMSRSLLMRLSIDSEKHHNEELLSKVGFIPEPTYGGQFSIHGTSDTPYEGKAEVIYEYIKGKYADGSEYELRSPAYKLTNLKYGEFHKDVNIAPRIGLALIGLGHLEAIDPKDILANEDVEDRDKDGISGKANWVYNPETNQSELGRFTWKAAAATVKHQSANAAHNDMGLSNPLFPTDNCTKNQKECNDAHKGDHQFDLPMERLDAITFYLKTLKIPKQRESKNFEKGEKLFESLGCVKCHIPKFNTQDGYDIYPYSDLLLHDMGEALADGHTMFRANGREFRTPPLWGIGLYENVSRESNYLHDGRARTIEEAIIWHGGEAESQKEAFKKLDKKQREYLLEFLKGI